MKHRQAAKLADEALGGDSEQLLKEASELLTVIQKYVSVLQKKQQTTDSQEMEDAQQLASMLEDMGMASALTKKQIGSGKRGENVDEYYELLARQVADFVLPKLPKMGGVLTLTDVFCLFNRARGTNLISPDDLAEACQLLSTLNLGISKRTFPSGIVVIQMDSMLDNSEKIVELCPTTALEASHVLKMSPLLATEQLEEAERMGLLCRDETLERTCFFPNRFLNDW
jgi:ESCRT-II complex subunit VPS36